MRKYLRYSILFFIVLISTSCKRSFSLNNGTKKYMSAIGDPGMQRDGLRVAIESWNQCNEVGEETPNFGSPRAADCFDVIENPRKEGYTLQHKVTEHDNKLGVGTPIPGESSKSFNNIDLYAAEKEVYLGSKCQVSDKPNSWQFWMIMLKNGNMDTYAALCPKDGVKVGPYGPDHRFDCFGKGCMRHPTMHHKYTTLVGNDTLMGRFFGTWDVDSDLSKLGIDEVKNKSFYSVTWKKEIGKGSWVFHHVLKTSKRFPWLMLYLRSDAIQGFSGGYHYDTRGMIKTKYLVSPNFKVRFTLNVTKGGGSKSQFYLMDMGSCWKNNGQPCDGDVTSDVTRYSEMIITPETKSWCRPHKVELCPPYHTFSNGSRVHREDTRNYPYDAYHMYCGPGNGKHLAEPNRRCDPFSNPQAQEILQILPHPVWGEYGYPTKKGEGWIGDSKTWLLDVGRMSQNLYFYQDPGTQPIKRRWSSIDLGVEVYRDPDQVVEWTVSDFDILVPEHSFTSLSNKN
ncbi:uncharacterized protein LOC104882806 [Beta vulgaris subsp. vulgaris]|uniref:uncharacterized protein LOC104882806 n=1 Tax=Beta vulgaris subsp. vulgaris TaxID=3555 RepID=UPI0005402FF4|nr:uncharacterized protein LOC104882806 [Beta vulgaris subsp. vulgaris]